MALPYPTLSSLPSHPVVMDGGSVKEGMEAGRGAVELLLLRRHSSTIEPNLQLNQLAELPLKNNMDWSSALIDLKNLLSKKEDMDINPISGKKSPKNFMTSFFANKKGLVASHIPSVGSVNNGSAAVDLGNILSLPENDEATKLLKQIAKSISEKNLIKVQNQKIKELRVSNIKTQLELRKYLKSLFGVAGVFKSDLAFNQNVVYKFNKKTATFLDHSRLDTHRIGAPKILLAVKNLYYILKNSFLTFGCIISKPILEITPGPTGKVKIKLFYFSTPHSALRRIERKMKRMPRAKALDYWMKLVESGEISRIKNTIAMKYKEIEFLCIKLSKIMNTSIVLELVELKGYQLEGNILANSIGMITDKNKRSFRRAVTRTFRKSIIMNPDKLKYLTSPFTKGKVNGGLTNIIGNKSIAFFTGINIRLAGRLSRQSIIPRKTVKTLQKGSLARRHTDFLTKSRYTAKNRRGIFCYTITIGHKYY